MHVVAAVAMMRMKFDDANENATCCWTFPCWSLDEASWSADGIPAGSACNRETTRDGSTVGSVTLLSNDVRTLHRPSGMFSSGKALHACKHDAFILVSAMCTVGGASRVGGSPTSEAESGATQACGTGHYIAKIR